MLSAVLAILIVAIVLVVARLAEDAPIQPPPVMRNLPAEPEPRMPELDELGNIAEDVHCRHCGYNLRGLPPAGTCPECHILNLRSLFGDQLRFSDPNWIRRLDNGVRLLLGAIFAGVVAGVLGSLAIGAYAAATGGGMPSMTVLALFSAFMTLITFVWIAAVWMITTPDPGGFETETPINARTLARYCILASLASVPIGILQQQGMFSPAGSAGGPPAATMLDTVLLLLSAGLGIVAIVGTAAGIVYLRSLALRIPSLALAWQTKVAGWGYVVFAILGQITGVAWALVAGAMAAAAALTAGMMVLFAGNCFVVLGGLVFAIWMIVVLIRYAAELRKAREGAERFAAAATSDFTRPPHGEVPR